MNKRIYVAILSVVFSSVLISCTGGTGGSGGDGGSGGGDANSDSPTTAHNIGSIQKVDGPQVGRSSIGFRAEDEKGNTITAYLPEAFSDYDMQMKEGVDFGTPPDYIHVQTNKFIQIAYPKNANGHTVTITVRPADAFNTVFVRNAETDTLIQTAYITNNKRVVMFRATPKNGNVTFALALIDNH